MEPLGLAGSIDDSFGNYFNMMKDIILNKLSDKDFVGNVDFQINIKNGQINNINIGEKKSIKI